jgi:hypothetical protein
MQTKSVGGSRFRPWKEGRGQVVTKWSSIWNTDCRQNSFRSHLLTARAYGDAGQVAHGDEGPVKPRPAPLSSELRHRTAYPANQAGSHLGSTLNPGGAVLTLGVFRRSRSVACIHADASPSEVHAKPWWHLECEHVKPTARRLQRLLVLVSTGARGRIAIRLHSSGRGWLRDYGRPDPVSGSRAETAPEPAPAGHARHTRYAYRVLRGGGAGVRPARRYRSPNAYVDLFSATAALRPSARSSPVNSLNRRS